MRLIQQLEGKTVSRLLNEYDVELVHETEKAWLLTQGLTDAEGKQIKFWVPKSVGELEKDGKFYTLTVPINWAIDKGLE